MAVHQLSRREARRIAVRAQLLDADRPTDLVETVRHLTLLQIDHTNAVAPSADLVAWSRLGARYRPADLVEALENRTFVELKGMIRPYEDISLFRARMPDDQFSSERARQFVAANDEFRRDILARLDVDGPLPQSALPDTAKVPWGSSGWNNDRNVGMMLECLVSRGEVAVADRDGRERMWDLAHRVYPSEVVPEPEASRVRAERLLRSLGLARARGLDDPEVGEPVTVAGVRGTWRADPAQLDRPFAGRTALLSPLDRLIYDRRRMAEIFEFDYTLEMFKPAARRRWGFYALPILHGDRLIGKLDATADRRHRVLRVDAIHEDEAFDRATAAAVRHEIEELARRLGLGLDLPA